MTIYQRDALATKVIEVRELSMTYPGGRTALSDVDLDLGPGMTGLLGVNGAGKTTLIRLLAGVLRPTSGTVRIEGLDLADGAQRRTAQARLGYLPQDVGVYPELTARQFLDYLARLKGLADGVRRRARVREVIELVALEDAANTKLKAYSGGMRRRVGIAQALLNDPSVLIVDEPTAGLDPEERLRFRGTLATLAAKRTVLLSTHIVDDVATTCGHVVVLAAGQVLFDGLTGGLATQGEARTWTLDLPHGALVPAGQVSAAPIPAGIRYRIISSQRPHPQARSEEPTIEDGYVALVRSRDKS